MKLKKIVLLLFTALFLISCAACTPKSEANPNETPEVSTPSETEEKLEAIPLSEEEQRILKEMGEDVQSVSEEDFGNTVTELVFHGEDFVGQVFQMEGLYTVTAVNQVETPFVSRTMVNGQEKTVCGLPLKYLEKDLSDGAWIRVTGIINTADFEGETATVLEVVAVEALETPGQAELSWTGPAHQH